MACAVGMGHVFRGHHVRPRGTPLGVTEGLPMYDSSRSHMSTLLLVHRSKGYREGVCSWRTLPLYAIPHGTASITWCLSRSIGGRRCTEPEPVPELVVGWRSIEKLRRVMPRRDNHSSATHPDDH